MACRESGSNKQQDLVHNYRLKFHLRALHTCGLLPPESISSSPWKSRLYGLYTCLTLVWFFPTITAMYIEMFKYLDSLDKAIPIIFQISAFVLSGMLAMYFVYKRKVVVKLFDVLEKDFRLYIERLSVSKEQLRRMESSLYFGKIISNVFIGLGWMVVLMWSIIPCAKGYIEFVLQINQDDIEENSGKYFGFSMWLPPGVNKSPTYEIAHILHGFSVFTCAMRISGCYMSMLGLMYHTASQFEMLVDLIGEFDVMCSADSQTEPQCVCETQEGEDVGQEVHTEDAAKEGTQRLIANRDTQLYQHLVLCAKYHQQIIE
jgi:hypothetical protein